MTKIITFKIAEQTPFFALASMGAKNIHYLENGKPVADNCFVSITHSGGSAAVCISGLPVGIDMEALSAARDFQRLADRYFSEKELEYYRASPSPERFYEIWTRKEAYAKIDGAGLKMIFKGLDTLSLNGVQFSTNICDGFVITVCEQLEGEK